jgi:hypothetical protein
MTHEQSFENSGFTQAIQNRTDDRAMRGRCGPIDGYSAMAKDAAHEREAEEWSEGLIGDASTET